MCRGMKALDNDSAFGYTCVISFLLCVVVTIEL